MDEEHVVALQAEIKRMLAAALDAGERHVADTTRRDELHIGETERRDELHTSELHRRDDVHEHELETVRAALDNLDEIGQAKGIIVGSMGCSADEAFRLLTKQSQVENRKLIEIAAEIAARSQRKRPSN